MTYKIIDLKVCSRKYGIFTDIMCGAANWILKIHEVDIRVQPLKYEWLLTKLAKSEKLKNLKNLI